MHSPYLQAPNPLAARLAEMTAQLRSNQVLQAAASRQLVDLQLRGRATGAELAAARAALASFQSRHDDLEHQLRTEQALNASVEEAQLSAAIALSLANNALPGQIVGDNTAPVSLPAARTAPATASAQSRRQEGSTSGLQTPGRAARPNLSPASTSNLLCNSRMSTNGRTSNSGSTQSSSDGIRSSDSNKKESCSASCPEMDVVELTSNSLDELLRLANGIRRPTVFDLSKRDLHSSTSGQHLLSASDVTFRNGTIHLAGGDSGSSLCVQGTGVEMEGVRVQGGRVGLKVQPGASLTLRNCSVERAFIGVWVGGTAGETHSRASTLVAEGLSVGENNGGSGLAVGCNGNVVLKNSDISGGKGYGISVSGGAFSRLRATDVSCCNNKGKGVVVHSGADVVMTRCTITGNRDGSVLVRHRGSKAVLASCTLDTKAVVGDWPFGGKIEVRN